VRTLSIARPHKYQFYDKETCNFCHFNITATES